jgi:hypothetical protein
MRRMFKFSVKIWQNPSLIPALSQSLWIAVSGDSFRGGTLELFQDSLSFYLCLVALNVRHSAGLEI